jgi:hypothetical protein
MDNNCTMIVPPKIVGMMCGVSYARIFPSGKVQLTYTDNTTETATLTAQQLEEGRENFFSFVSDVQDQRPR